jgi:hypothetical protein
MREKMVEANKPLEYEPLVLNSLTEIGAKNRAYKKLTKYQDGRGWKYNDQTNEWNEVSGAEDMERSVYLGIARKIWVIVAVDKNGIFSFESLVELANTNADLFVEIYTEAVAANPTLALEGEDKAADPNE